jgi:hypothetical protein
VVVMSVWTSGSRGALWLADGDGGEGERGTAR